MKITEATKIANKIIERLKSEWPQERWQLDVCLDIQEQIINLLMKKCKPNRWTMREIRQAHPDEYSDGFYELKQQLIAIKRRKEK